MRADLKTLPCVLAFAHAQVKCEQVMQRIFIDASATYIHLRRNSVLSGIQRVVVSAAAEILRIKSSDNVYLLVQAKDNCFAISLDGLSPEILANPTTLKLFLHGAQVPAMNFLHKYNKRKLKYIFHRGKFEFMAKYFPEKFERKTGYRAHDFLGRKGVETGFKSIKFEDIVKSDDVVISLDSSWDDYQIEGFEALKSRHGVKIFTMVHDMIPLVYGFTTAVGVQRKFINWLERSSSYTDIYLANSDSTREDFLKVHSNPETVKTVKLAHSFSNVSSEVSVSNYMRKAYPQYFETFPNLADMIDITSNLRFDLADDYVLCVGTLEPRKNNLRLARAWYNLSQKYPDLPKLYFAGRKGWGSDELEKFLSDTHNVNGLVKIIPSPSDEELAALYKNCLFFAFPSLYEGWGLPIGEGINYGKTGVVAANSSLPEVGLDMVVYCDEKSISSITSALESLLFDKNLRAQKEMLIRNTRLRTWADFAHDLIDIAEERR
ncbi:glycosyltransferase family 4 protein [Falsigemmobacter intermedius]|uniref:Glycosyltransferase family 1 protein n=1 Tax=Falsigemmobacter intermedius TaxID=1553448 RepID=A0A3S3UI96_9RHOB|nr:glycosyltransferase family 1 protein [Falsigemmobacter intermedius]RWY34360.1 glycosyltransferase family 1 protein [Falsigemmobacter intermedius]